MVTRSPGGCRVDSAPREIREGQNNKRTIKIMKNRSRLAIFAMILSAVTCFGLLSGARAADGDLGGGNTNEGYRALNSLSGGGFNTGLGWYSLGFLTDAFYDTAVGAGALVLDNRGENTAVGTAALLLNTTGLNNNAFGVDALLYNDSGDYNNAHGHIALFNNVDGSQNNAFGDRALRDSTGSFNTAFGDDALLTCTGDSNTALGNNAGSNLIGGEGNIYIGAQVQAGGTGEFEFIRIGDDTAFTFPYDTYIAGIFDRDVDVGTAIFVYVDANGKLGTNLVNAAGHKVATPQAMLKQSRNQQKRIAELEATVERQQKGMEVLTAQLKEQAAQIQKVSAQLEVSKPAPQVVANKP
jgi:hypothetical protein